MKHVLIIAACFLTTLLKAQYSDVQSQNINTAFDYSDSYFLKSGSMPVVNDLHLDAFSENNVKLQSMEIEDWRKDAGGKLKTAGALLLTSVAFSALSVLVYSANDNDMFPLEMGYALTGASGVFLIASCGFVIGAGNSIQGR